MLSLTERRCGRDSEGMGIASEHLSDCLLAHVQAALHTCHYGEARVVVIEHRDLEILVQAVGEGYYALMAVESPAPLAMAMNALGQAAVALRTEMG